MSDRELVLRRIRAALGKREPVAVTGEQMPESALDEVPPAVEGGAVAESGDHRASTPGEASVVSLFIERCRAYGASVCEADAGAVPAAVTGALRCRGSGSLVVPPALPPTWFEETLQGVTVDAGLSAAELDGIDAALTGSLLAIAETGTIVLRADEVCGRRALSLIPDHHICVVDRRSVFPTVAAAFAELGDTESEGTALTLVSGPSATADIELRRVEGVHGPRKLDVIVLK